jgi:precorrin-8X/cobalt-precorrin-8 methylmutase
MPGRSDLGDPALSTSGGIHPIEAESYRILAERVDLGALPPDERAVVSRVIHASADLDYASSLCFAPGAVARGVAALRDGGPVVTDVEMVRHGITRVPACCHLADAMEANGTTRSAAGMAEAARRHPAGAVVVVGCAPTALWEVLSLARAGRFAPALVVGLPVGFVGAAEAKEAARRSPLATITNRGDKGGSAVAAAVINSLAALAGPLPEGGRR